ncbi:MAG: hypothetical protein LWW95_08440 [Candidatus Desulfofervidus auxilii]|nr:hypothetical protein [Candidatus Desulfofervidus auxilii]
MALQLKGDVGPALMITLWGWNQTEDTIYPVYVIDNGLRTTANLYAYDVASSEYKKLTLTPSIDDSLSTANLINALNVVSLLYAFDGTNFRRLNVEATPGESITPSNCLHNCSIIYGYDGSSFICPRIIGTPGATISPANFLGAVTLLYGYDGANYRRVLVNTSGNLEVVQKPDKTEGSSSGTTTDSETVVATIDLRNKKGVTIFVKNNGDTNDMDVKIKSYVRYSGTIDYEEDSKVLAPGEKMKINLENLQKVTVSVKSTTAGASTSYIVEYLSYQ